MSGYMKDCCTEQSSSAAVAVNNPRMTCTLEVHLFYTHVTYREEAKEGKVLIHIEL